MKQITTLIIGILLGAIITTSIFLILKDDSNKMPNISDRTQLNERKKDTSNIDTNSKDNNNVDTNNN